MLRLPWMRVGEPRAWVSEMGLHSTAVAHSILEGGECLIRSLLSTEARCQLLAVDKVNLPDEALSLGLGRIANRTRYEIRTCVRHSYMVRGIRSIKRRADAADAKPPATALAAAIPIAISQCLGPAGLMSWRAPSSLNRCACCTREWRGGL